MRRPTPTARAEKRSYQYHGITADYAVERFIYHADADRYVCPQGRRLVYDATYPRDGTMRYRSAVKIFSGD